MKRKANTDPRRTLQIAEETWDREDAAGQHEMVRLAAAQGYSLTVIRPDGETWKPEPDLRAGET